LKDIVTANPSQTKISAIPEIPSIIKYMGSKKPILNFIVSNIEEIHNDELPVCDLFSGSCSISAALRKRFDFISNDIQEYSSILGQTYFSDLSVYNFEEIEKKIKLVATNHTIYFKNDYSKYFYDYTLVKDLKEYQKIELSQRMLINTSFEVDFHLFVKHYSGTYWSFEQCVWLDSLRKSAEQFKGQKIYFAILSSIMYAMSYSTQSTGHFAQYRDGNSIEAMHNIIIYRNKNIYELFSRKLKELVSTLDNHLKTITSTTLSFTECLKTLSIGSTVYADPPYAPVHYSRFYHVLETLVKYDYPDIEHKGRYRGDRHQSPFSQKSNAIAAFTELYQGVLDTKSQLLLSYSGSGVVSIDKIISLAKEYFHSDYVVEVKEVDHKHSTMGRFEDQTRDVIEYLIIARFKNG
jgi:adenine-specific DNA-methyltransferase